MGARTVGQLAADEAVAVEEDDGVFPGFEAAGGGEAGDVEGSLAEPDFMKLFD